MTYGYQRIINSYGTPVQQSMTADPKDYAGMHLSRMMLGVVLEVHPADSNKNRSAYQSADSRGYLHTATVLVVQDGRDTNLLLSNVIITPDHISGLDDYVEHLPRGCSGLVTGEATNSQLNNMNPYDLDGDWCVVGFLGGSLDQPFIVRWWPHGRNRYDTATSGQARTASATSPTLVQDGRYFRRVNGVEFVVTKPGNLYVSTYRANSTLKFGSDTSPEDGRWPRTLQEEDGGSVKAWIKPSQSLEIDFNTPQDGIGVLDVADPELPQTNPATSSTSNAQKDNTYVLFDKERIEIKVPDTFRLISSSTILLESSEDTTLNVGGDLNADITADAVVTVNGAVELSATRQMSLSGATISLNNGTLGGVVGSTPLTQAFTAFVVALRTAAAGAMDTTYANAVTAAADTLLTAVTNSGSSTVTVG